MNYLGAGVLEFGHGNAQVDPVVAASMRTWFTYSRELC